MSHRGEVGVSRVLRDSFVQLLRIQDLWIELYVTLQGTQNLNV